MPDYVKRPDAQSQQVAEEVKRTVFVPTRWVASRWAGWGRVDDVVGAVVYLASPAAALVTGASLLVDGGYTAQ